MKYNIFVAGWIKALFTSQRWIDSDQVLSSVNFPKQTENYRNELFHIAKQSKEPCATVFDLV